MENEHRHKRTVLLSIRSPVGEVFRVEASTDGGLCISRNGEVYAELRFKPGKFDECAEALVRVARLRKDE